jgi:hypothetical protein
MHKSKIVATFVVLGALCANAEAKMFKWVDDNGTTHYGETIPPEYSNKDATELNKNGEVEKRIERPTPEGRRAKEKEEAKKEVEQQTALEIKRRDNALLSTFSNEKEIDLARERGSQQVEARIGSVKLMLKTAQESLAEHNKEQKDLLSQNKKIPASLTDDIGESASRVEKLQKELEQNVQELEKVKARFDADKQRYHELKSGNATSTSSTTKK